MADIFFLSSGATFSQINSLKNRIKIVKAIDEGSEKHLFDQIIYFVGLHPQAAWPSYQPPCSGNQTLDQSSLTANNPPGHRKKANLTFLQMKLMLAIMSPV